MLQSTAAILRISFNFSIKVVLLQPTLNKKYTPIKLSTQYIIKYLKNIIFADIEKMILRNISYVNNII